MADFGEKLPLVEKDLVLLADKQQNQPEGFKKLPSDMLMSQAESLVWERSITSNVVFFPQPDGKRVWGLEYSIPLCCSDTEEVFKDLLKGLDKKNIVSNDHLDTYLEERKNRRYYNGPLDLKLPRNIEKIKVLDLAPQEGFPKKYRNLNSKTPFSRSLDQNLHPAVGDSVIDRVMRFLNYDKSVIKTKQALDDLFKNVLGGSTTEKELLKKILTESQANELLFVHAHGRDSNIIGEQSGPVVGKFANEKQAEGNWIDLTEVIERYDKPETFAAILVASCYIGEENPPVRRVPVFRLKGLSGYNIRTEFGLNQTLVSLPEKK